MLTGRVKKDSCSRHPQHIDENNWYYEYPDHISFVHETRINGLYINTQTINIPRWKLIKSLSRMTGRGKNP